MYSRIYSGALQGVTAYPVLVEVDISRGLPGFCMVGSLGSEVRESRERVMVALKNAGLNLPPERITVNLSPADIRKEGTAFDLPVAVGILEAMGMFGKKSAPGEKILFLGELGLNGELKRARGVLPIVRMAAAEGIGECIVPRENAGEGAVIPGVRVRGAAHISQVIAFLRAGEKRDNVLPAAREDVDSLTEAAREELPDYRDIAGQETAKRAAEIAAAGFHNLLLTGPPGTGKSLLARGIAGILPGLSREESLEVTSVYSVAGLLKEGQSLVRMRPFRSPHHTVTQAALIGGGSVPRPGEISLAHRGVLFLDELPEFGRGVLETLRQPLEERMVNLSRLYGSVSFPSNFILVCAMNPCPCGYYPDRNRCRCTETQIRQYMGRISGPVLDRIDLCVELQPVDYSEGRRLGRAESSAGIRERVLEARERQKHRLEGSGFRFNGDIPGRLVGQYCVLGQEEQQCMEELYRTLKLSMRACHRVLRTARTIADLAGMDEKNGIKKEHLLEAAGYRPSTEYWMG